MRTILFLIGLFIINISLVVGQPLKNNKNIDNVKTIEDFRSVKFKNTPCSIENPKFYPLDTDRYIWGTITLEINKEEDRDAQIKNKIKENTQKQENSRFKSTYLDFTITQEENIS